MKLNYKKIIIIFIALIQFSCVSKVVIDSSAYIENLDVDSESEYWKPILYFCALEEIDVPVLLSYCKNGNKNVRMNSVIMLGDWLLEEEAIDLFTEYYYEEDDLYIRYKLVGGLYNLVLDLDERDKLFDKMLLFEENEDIKEFLQGAMDYRDSYIESVNKTYKIQQEQNLNFQEIYNELFDSYGKEGDLKELEKASSYKNENDLLALRVQIMERQSDEAFYDYIKVNSIITMNRYVEYNTRFIQDAE